MRLGPQRSNGLWACIQMDGEGRREDALGEWLNINAERLPLRVESFCVRSVQRDYRTESIALRTAGQQRKRRQCF